LVTYGKERVAVRCEATPLYRCMEYLKAGASVIVRNEYTPTALEQLIQGKGTNQTVTLYSPGFSLTYLYRLSQMGFTVRYTPTSTRVQEYYTALTQGLELNVSLAQVSATAAYQLTKEAGAKVHLTCGRVSVNACKDLVALGAKVEISRNYTNLDGTNYLLNYVKQGSPATITAYGYDLASLLSFATKGATVRF
jgi:hypothetical protein